MSADPIRRIFDKIDAEPLYRGVGLDQEEARLFVGWLMRIDRHEAILHFGDTDVPMEIARAFNEGRPCIFRRRSIFKYP